MARQDGTLKLSSNIEPIVAAPLDARTKTANLADLVNPSILPYAYVGMEVYVESEQKKYMLVGDDPTNSSNWVESGGEGGSSRINATAVAELSGTEEDGIYVIIGDAISVQEVIDGTATASNKEIDTCIIDYELYSDNQELCDEADILWVIINAPDESSSIDSVIEVNNLPETVNNKVYNVQGNYKELTLGNFFKIIRSYEAFNSNEELLESLSDYAVTGDIWQDSDEWSKRVQGILTFQKEAIIKETILVNEVTIPAGKVTSVWVRDGEWNSGGYYQAKFYYEDGSSTEEFDIPNFTSTTSTVANSIIQIAEDPTVYSKNVQLATSNQLDSMLGASITNLMVNEVRNFPSNYTTTTLGAHMYQIGKLCWVHVDYRVRYTGQLLDTEGHFDFYSNSYAIPDFDDVSQWNAIPGYGYVSNSHRTFEITLNSHYEGALLPNGLKTIAFRIKHSETEPINTGDEFNLRTVFCFAII